MTEENAPLETELTVENALDRMTKDPMLDPLDDTLSNEVLIEMVQLLKKRWSAPFTDDEPVALQAARRFHLENEYQAHSLLPSGANSLETSLFKVEFAVTRLQTQCERRGLSDSTLSTQNVVQDPGFDISADILKVRECVIRMHRVLESDLLARKCCDPSWGSEIPTMRNIYGISMIETQKMNDIHSLVYFILKMLAHKGQRRYMEACQEEIVSPAIPVRQADGSILEQRFSTRSYRRVCDIEEFIRMQAPKETAFEMWKITLNGHNFSNAVKQLRECKDPEFAQLQPDRHWHSFKNGLYNTSEGCFQPFGHPTMSPPVDVVSCNYHEMMFPWEELSKEELNWYSDIPTPSFHSIIEYQMAKQVQDDAQREEVIKWIYIFLGRFLYEVNEKDSWQVIPFFIGRAGTGKSKLLDSIKEFFQEKDIALISNDTQKGFGLETVYDKFAWRSLEVKNDFALDQAQLQSMVTGEEVSIQRKNKPAINVIWKSPGILAGNEVPNWSDNSGSISRRIIQIRFDTKVDPKISDPFMGTKIRQERPYLLHKLVSAQLDAVELFGHKDIWSEQTDLEGNRKTILPKYFHDLKLRMQESTHAIVNFLHSPEVVLDPKAGMPFKVFKHHANDYIQKNKLSNFRWIRDKYVSVFEDNGLRIVKLSSQFLAAYGGTIEYAGVTYKESEEWVFGVNLLEHQRKDKDT